MNKLLIKYFLEYKYRRLILVLIDVFIISSTFFLTIWITLKDSSYLYNYTIIQPKYLLPLNILIITIYFITGQYNSLARYIGSKATYVIAARNLLVIFSLLIIYFFFGKISLESLKLLILFWVNLTFFVSITRFILKDIITGLHEKYANNKKNVVIYGAGNAGAKLSFSLQVDNEYNINYFIDDSRKLWKRTIDGIPIYSPIKLDQDINEIDIVLLAIPSAPRYKRLKIIKNLSEKGLNIMQIPSLNDIADGKATVNTLIPISIEDLLGRKSKLNKKFEKIDKIKQKNILVTGAGGSIGSEICRQILEQNPSKLFLLERFEPSLYSINKILKKKLLKLNTEIIPILGDIDDVAYLRTLIIENNINVIFNTAAYKHVPLVESNPIQGIKNNCVSTFKLCELAYQLKVDQLIHISTDKAVRPSNVMGATKRFSELIVQAFANISNEEYGNKKTCFSMVRFGNVLNSSGSVVPLFKEQIKAGGPITLTHEDVIRYFMTIPEAARLVIQVSRIAKGGEIFLLDMGEPVKIKVLAEQMIKLSGLTVKDNENPNGDIEIKITGLRPGEKLYEELLISSKAIKTSNPQIFIGEEDSLSMDKIKEYIELFKTHIKNNDSINALNLLSIIVPEWSQEK